MNRSKLIAVLVALTAFTAFAVERYVCALPFGIGVSNNTYAVRLLQDGGTVYDAGTSGGLGCCYDGGFTPLCNWPQGANNLVMQCSTDVLYTTGSATTTSAGTTNSFFVDFTNYKDPKRIPLYPKDQYVAVRGVADGGTCTFGTEFRVNGQ